MFDPFHRRKTELPVVDSSTPQVTNDARTLHDRDVDAVMAKYDTNGDGKFDRLEVFKIVKDLARERKVLRNYKRLFALACAVLVAMSALLIGSSVIGAQLSKESERALAPI
ncbi:hypothetical protein T492DRAFT_842849 [Pavlovales sp. CCMP2436]|nr:hypothetical protein T492DRAFT_842849 [Pavlovales sp. CCMP2436]